MQNWMRTIVPTEDFQEVKKYGQVYIIHLDPVEDENGTTSCYECSVNSEPDMAMLADDLATWKAAAERRRTSRERKQRMREILQELADTDYIVLKRAEGIDISEYDEKYKPNFLDWRQALRDEYNQLEEQERGE